MVDYVRTPPRAAGLTDAAIVHAAREILAEAGVEGLTMRRLSARLGVALGATYHYFPTRDALLGRVVQDLYSEVDLPAAESGDWAQRVKQLTIDMARVVGQYPGLAAYLMAHMDDMVPVAANQAMVGILADAGFSIESAAVVMSALYFFGTGLSANLASMRSVRRFDHVDAEALVGAGLDMLLAGARLRLETDTGRGANRAGG
jgi:AcrR family transcriptional regulator